MNVAKLVVKVGADISDLKRKMDQSTAVVRRVGQQMQKTGKAMTMYGTLPILGVGVAMLKTAADYERGMNRVQALTGATETQFAALGKQAQSLGKTTQYSAGQAADAMGFLAMAGYETNQIIGAMPHTLRLAAAAQLDLGTSADIVSNIMTGFGLTSSETENAVDVLTKAFTSSNTNLQGLGEAMKYAGPVAKGLGISFTETAAAIGMLAKAGIPGAMAGRTLRAALVRLANETPEVTKTLQQFGIATKDSTGALLPLAEMLKNIEDSAAGAEDVMRIFGKTAGAGMLGMLGQGSQALEDFKEALENSAGTAEKIATIQMEGLSGALLKLKSAWEALAIQVADAGLLNAMTNMVNKTADFTRQMSSAEKSVLKWAAIFAGAVAASGPILTGLGTIAAHPVIAGLSVAFVGIGLLIRKFSQWNRELKQSDEALTRIAEDMNEMDMEGLRSAMRDTNAAIMETESKLEELRNKNMGSSFSDMGGGIGPADAFNERLDKMTKLLAHQIRIRNTLSFTMMEQTKVEREAIRVAVEDAAVQLDVADSLDDVADALGAVTKARELETRAANAELQAWSAQMRELDNYNAHMNQAAASSRQRTTAAQNASNSGGGGYGGGYSGSGYSGRYPESNIPHGFEALGMLQQAQAAGGDNSGKETAKAAGLITSGMAIGFGIGTAIGGPPGGIIGYGVGAAAGVVAALFEPARDVVGAIADAVWPFAAGGVVTSPTLGLVAENGPEAVIPLDQLSGIMAGGGGSDVHVHLELDGRELTSAVLQNLGGELTRRRI